MAKAYRSAAAFKSALEARMRMRAVQSGLPLQSLQMKFAIERLLARLFHAPDVPWLLKGGYALELRYRPRARTTKDVDLSVPLASTSSTITDLRDQLQTAAEIDLRDHISFRIGELKSELTQANKGGGRFPCEAVMLGKTYAKFHIDAGFGDPSIDEPEQLIGDDLLEFAGLSPAVVLAIPKTQQFAEKVHAYTFPSSGRLNTRTKDLVDLVLLIERGELEVERVRSALATTFQVRNSHLLPGYLSQPPEHWKFDFSGMAAAAGLSTTDLLAAFGILDDFWNTNSLGKT